MQISFAANTSIPFLSTGGGHGFSTTLDRLHNGIALDLGNFNHVSVDTDANTMTIGAAVRFRDVVGPLGKAKKELRQSPFPSFISHTKLINEKKQSAQSPASA